MLEQTLFEVKRVIVGQDRLVERLLVALLAGGHCLLEGVPGVAKTLAAQTLAAAVGGTFSRIQFTPDLVPSDIVGTRIYRAVEGDLRRRAGPGDGQPGAGRRDQPGAGQGAVGAAGGDGRAAGVDRRAAPTRCREPFLVLATQNPIESEGVYQLPEAQRDRFLMRVVVGYPTDAEELGILYRMGADAAAAAAGARPGPAAASCRHGRRTVFVHHALAEYVVRLVLATREPGAVRAAGAWPRQLAYGASPRATLGLVAAGPGAGAAARPRLRAARRRPRLAADVLAHRLVLSFDAVADGVSAESIVRPLVEAVPPPPIAPRRSSTARASGMAAHERGRVDQRAGAGAAAAAAGADRHPAPRRPAARASTSACCRAPAASWPAAGSTGRARTRCAGWTGR